MFKFYEVGGKVRDELLGLTNKDIDYVAVPCEEALKENLTTCDMFQLLWEHLIAEKFEIFLVTPDCYTIRARFPNSKDSSFVIMDFMGKSLLCAWRNNNTCKVGMPFLCRRIIKKGKSGFMYKNKFYSLETKYGWVF